MLSSAKIKLPSDRNPSTINREVICEALNIFDDGDEDPASQEFLLKTAKTLRLEFRQILKVENLQCLTSLTRLFLDNNFIEHISGLDSLVNLTWLDLSFNKIRKIKGLDNLRKLEVLALYNNEISALENLHHLDELKVLRLGQNRIPSKENVVYLRRLKSLKTLSIKENPMCDDKDWEKYCIALLPNLTNVECHYVQSAEREEAVNKFQGDIFRAQNQEEQEKEAYDKERAKLEIEKRHRSAFVASLRGKFVTRPAVNYSTNADFQN